MADSESSQEAQLGDPTEEHVEPEWVAPPPLDPDERTFDAFDEGTWNFTPAPTPWYRTGHASLAVTAVTIAAIALVVSVVLLAFRGSSREGETPAPDTSTTPSTVEAPATTSAVAPPPPPPPPPPPTAATEITQPPVIVRTPPKPTKKPEINVTRSSLSVSPPKPPNR